MLAWLVCFDVLVAFQFESWQTTDVRLRSGLVGEQEGFVFGELFAVGGVACRLVGWTVEIGIVAEDVLVDEEKEKCKEHDKN